MTGYEVQLPKVADGTYTYARVNAYGPATQTRVVIHDGSLFDFALNGESTRADRLGEIEQAVKAELVWHIRQGLAQRLREDVSVAA